ncbi:hypothetical protein Lal_00036535 [Lupinus albus]|uniref:Uncharacterized protein n=1 Tax=Lupinus albus TaxID=3870 RepID=A0A6A4P0R8_LUPAL|nr:hypothetical protein Lalb_Chr18g0046341 [Lupinus albus]KAF1892177.1 hypothetical protein Lal_00036535 [Lupinus albus]
MASNETMNLQSSLQDEDFDDDQPQNLSRLSVCTSSTLCDVDDEHDHVDNIDNVMSIYVSQLSIESFDADADGEFSDTKEDITPKMLTLSSDSENEVVGSCYSLPITPPRRRNMINHVGYVSENEAQKSVMMKTKNNDPMRSRSRRVQRRDYKRWGVNKNSLESSKKKEKEHVIQGLSGESDQSVGVMVITRPKGGRRSLCMDLEEVKACRDLGFELEHEKMLSFSNSALDTSSGANSPIANWRISSPGDDPRDVKARLKVWAQAVALASTSKYGT